MTDILLGLIALVVGLTFCFGGVYLMRLVIPIWGAFAGFALGAGLVSGFADERFLGSALGWVLGIVLAIVFALLAYLYYVVAVVLAMGSIGFALGSWMMIGLGVTWNWAIVLVAVAIGVVFAVAAVILDLPMVFLVVFSALGGAAVAVSGLMLLGGSVDTATFTDGNFVSLVRDSWWWYAIYLVTAILGILAQSRSVASMRASIREQWATTQAPWA